MMPAAERRLRELYASLESEAEGSERFRLDRAASYVADPVLDAKHARGLSLRMEAADAPPARIAVAKTLRSVRLASGGWTSRPLRLDLREGCRLEGEDFASAEALAEDLMDRLTRRTELGRPAELDRLVFGTGRIGV